MSDEPTVKNSSKKNPKPPNGDRLNTAPFVDEEYLRDVLRPFLEDVVDSTDLVARRDNDPVGIVHGYDDPADQEVAALVASSLAYGQVAVLREAVREVLAVLGAAPARALLRPEIDRWSDDLSDFVYRMTRGPDVIDLFVATGSVLREHGSLHGCYLAEDGTHLDRASHLVQTLRRSGHRPDVSRGFRYLIPDPADGSTTKRLHMFFRWMVRGPDAIDLGLWDDVSPADLLMPLDTHTSRICRYLGLTSRASTDRKTAEQVTAALRVMRPADPLYFDFALAHLGISKRCIHRRSPDHCPGCALEPVCGLE